MPKRSYERNAEKIREFILANVPAHPTDIVSVTMTEFEVSRPTVIVQMNQLIKAKKISKTGTRNKVVYRKLANKVQAHWTEKIGEEGDENRIWEERFESKVRKLPKNVYDILRYSVSEMINNAIDHSEGSTIALTYAEDPQQIVITISDNGVGIFNKISKALKLSDHREAILHLSKGKFTTDARNHSGQGIFFTSRAVDEFGIMSSELSYIRHRKEADWLIESRKRELVGTGIFLSIRKDSDSDLTSTFKKFSDEEDPGFNKTHVYVTMAKLSEEQYVSRSQARRLVVGLEKFEEIILDFAKVRSVGQGFVDEVFRVFKGIHPRISISYINANADVDFMIKRSLTP